MIDLNESARKLQKFLPVQICNGVWMEDCLFADTHPPQQPVLIHHASHLLLANGSA
jgi:hypothetical protein